MKPGGAPKPQHNELSRESVGDRLSIRRLEHHGSDSRAFARLARAAEGPKPLPTWGPAGHAREPDVSRVQTARARLREQSLERFSPTGTQRRYAQRALQLIAGVTGHIEQRVDLRHAHALGSGLKLRNLITGLHFPFLDHAEIEARSSMPDQQRGHFRLVHSDA